MTEREAQIAFEEEAKTMNQDQLRALARRQAIEIAIGANLRAAIDGMREVKAAASELLAAKQARIMELELEILHKDRTITELREVIRKLEEQTGRMR